VLRKFRAIFATLIMAAGILFAVQAPAQAAFGDCPNEEMCIFDNANGGGFMYRFGSNVFGACTYNGRHATTSSATNRRSGSRVKFWSNQGCTTAQGVVSSWVYYGQNINMGLMDNNMYSFRWESCAGLSTCRY
jgi:hypothetical protein